MRFNVFRATVSVSPSVLAVAVAAACGPVSTTVPTLILSGTFDSNVAPSWGDDVTPGFSNSTVLRAYRG